MTEKVQTYRVKQGKSSITVKSITDEVRGVETREITIQRGKRTQRQIIEIDIATGKPLLPTETGGLPTESLYQSLLDELAAISLETMKSQVL